AAGARTLQHGSMRRWGRGLTCIFDDGSGAGVRRGEDPSNDAPAGAGVRATAPPPLASGDAAPSGRLGGRKESSGYAADMYAETRDLIDLLVGSEGTLALFTEVELALAPTPQATATLLGAFSSLDDAVAAAIQATTTGAAACELLDRTFLEVAASGGDAI